MYWDQQLFPHLPAFDSYTILSSLSFLYPFSAFLTLRFLLFSLYLNIHFLTRVGHSFCQYLVNLHDMSEPLAERMRPRTLDDYVGQEHLVGQGAVLRRMIESGHISSFILWGPPGVGKTTLAQIIAGMLKVPFFTLSAVTSGVKDVREVIDKARQGRFFNAESPFSSSMRFTGSPSRSKTRCWGLWSVGL
jgi:hypothetical protein